MALAIIFIIIMGILAWVLRPKKKLTRPVRLAILTTLIPLVVVAIAAIVFQLMYNADGKMPVSDISNTLFIVGLALIGVAVLTSAAFAIKRRSDIARGIGFSICIAVIIYILEFGLLEWMSGL